MVLLIVDLCSFGFYEYNSSCDWCGEVLKDRLLFWAAFFLRHSVHVLLKRPYSSMAGTHLAHTLTVKPVKCLGTDSEVCEGSWRRFLGVCELFDSWSSKSVLRVPGLPVVRSSLDFLLCCMFLLFHVTVTSPWWPTLGPNKAGNIVGNSRVWKEVIAPMHAPSCTTLHCCSPAPSCMPQNAHLENNLWISTSIRKICVDTHSVAWSGEMLHFCIEFAKIVLCCMACCGVCFFLFACLFCFVTLRWSDAL